MGKVRPQVHSDSWSDLAVCSRTVKKIKSKPIALLAVLLAGTSAITHAQEIISVNFWRTGGGQHDWASVLTLQPDQAAGFGDWNTTGWQNYILPWAPTQPQARFTLNGTEGSTATFTLKDCRNGGPYIWQLTFESIWRYHLANSLRSDF